MLGPIYDPLGGTWFALLLRASDLSVYDATTDDGETHTDLADLTADEEVASHSVSLSQVGVTGHYAADEPENLPSVAYTAFFYRQTGESPTATDLANQEYSQEVNAGGGEVDLTDVTDLITATERVNYAVSPAIEEKLAADGTTVLASWRLYQDTAGTEPVTGPNQPIRKRVKV